MCKQFQLYAAPCAACVLSVKHSVNATVVNIRCQRKNLSKTKCFVLEIRIITVHSTDLNFGLNKGEKSTGEKDIVAFGLALISSEGFTVAKSTCSVPGFEGCCFFLSLFRPDYMASSSSFSSPKKWMR